MFSSGPLPFDRNATGINAILTLDGGGLRGIICVEVLLVVESAIKKVLRDNDKKYLIDQKGDLQIDLADYFLAMSGVNTGVWITAYLASKGGRGSSAKVFNDRTIIEKYGAVRPGSLDGLKVLFFEYGKKIYGPNFEMFSLSHIFQLPWNIPGATFPKHPSKELEKTMMDFLGEVMMDDLDCILLVPAYDLYRKAAVLFASGNLKGQKDVPAYTYIMQTVDEPRSPAMEIWRSTVKVYENKRYALKKIAHAGSAAVTLHAAKKISAQNDESFELLCQDGGLMGNNPTLQTVIFIASNYGGDIDHISVLSIGTGITGGSMIDQATSGGLQWIMTSNDFFTVIMQGRSELIQAQLDMLYYFVFRESNNVRRGQYLRVQTSSDEERSEGVALQTIDDVSKLEQLRKIGQATADAFRDVINTFVDTYIFGHNLKTYEFKSYIRGNPTEYGAQKSPEPDKPTTS